MRVDWTDLALDRADEIAQHIAEEDRDAVVRWMVGLFDAADRLSDFPESGRVVPELGLCACRLRTRSTTRRNSWPTTAYRAT